MAIEVNRVINVALLSEMERLMGEILDAAKCDTSATALEHQTGFRAGHRQAKDQVWQSLQDAFKEARSGIGI